MPPINHQTVRLERGAHRSPDHGACVMEVASMLAGEPFSDRPGTACPVIGAFLRAYNDRVRARWRQDLLPCASDVVGSRDVSLQRWRVRLLVAGALGFHHARPRWRRALGWHRRRHLERLADAPLCDLVLEDLGVTVAWLLPNTAEGHTAALALIDALVVAHAPARQRPPAPVFVAR